MVPAGCEPAALLSSAFPLLYLHPRSSPVSSGDSRVVVLVPPVVVGCDSCHVCCDQVTVALGRAQGLTEEDSGVCKLISLLLWLCQGHGRALPSGDAGSRRSQGAHADGGR